MSNATKSNVSRLLHLAQDGDSDAHAELWQVLYSELRLRAKALMRGQHRNHSLSGTGLVHEVYLKLVRAGNQNWEDRKHFLAVASTAMRQVLVDHARKAKAIKRPPRHMAVQLDHLLNVLQAPCHDVLELDDALEQFKKLDPLMHTAIELRVFGSATVTETADILNMSVRTLERHYKLAKAKLKQILRP